MDLDIEGHAHLMTSEQFLDLASLPPSLTFVGGGYISFEFAHVAARAGAHVTMLHRDDRPLAEFDAGLVERLVARTRALVETSKILRDNSSLDMKVFLLC